ncbi:MAG: DUF4139 domain-containing protein [Pseudomonadota bacterium]
MITSTKRLSRQLKKLATSLALGTALATQGLAASFEVDGDVTAATIYPGAANVTRQITFDVPEGQHKLLVELAGANIDPNSVRLSGAAEGSIVLRGVDVRTVQKLADTGERRRRLEEQIASLNIELASIAQRQTVAEAQAQLVTNLVNTIPTVFSSESESVVLPDAADILDILNTVGQAQAKVVETRLALAAEDRDTREQITALELELADMPSRRKVLEAAIRISSDGDASGTLALSYLTNAVSWSPGYDLALDTLDDQPMLAIRSQASIVQTTGEDWKDVALTLSTARPSGATEAGILPSEQVSFLRPRPAAAPMARNKTNGGIALESMVQADAAAPMMIREEAANAQFAGYRATFSLPELSDLPSSNGARTVLIAQTDVTVDLETRATPLLSAEAFLHAAGQVPDGLTILPGEASLTRDGDLVGRTFLPRLATGAEFDIGFGPDDSVNVERLVADRSTGETGIITSSNRDRTAVSISVANLADRPRAITVIDRVPFAEADDIEIETTFPNGAVPTQTDVDGRRGVLAWTFDLAPGATRTIEARHTITWPSDKQITRDGNWPIRPRG